MDRRTFLTTAGAVVAAAAVPDARARQGSPKGSGPARFRTGLVAYSYRQALQAKTLTYEDLIRIAVETGTDGIDMTVYWLRSSVSADLYPGRDVDSILGAFYPAGPRAELHRRDPRRVGGDACCSRTRVIMLATSPLSRVVGLLQTAGN